MSPGAITKAAKTAGKSLAFFLGLVIFCLLLAVGTEAGSAWTVKRALQFGSDASGYELSFEDINGVLLDDLSFVNLSFRDPATAMKITAGRVSLSWNPFALFNHLLHIRNFQASQVVIDVPDVVDEEMDRADTDIDVMLQRVFSLPVSLQLDQSMISNVTIRSGTNQRIANIGISGKLDSQSLAMQTSLGRDANTSVSADLVLGAKPYALKGDVTWRTMAADMAFEGSLLVDGSLAELLVEHTLTAPVSLLSNGRFSTGLFDGGSPTIDLQHEIRAINGAGFSQPALDRIQNLSGRLTTAGTIDQLDLQGDVEARVEDFGDVAATFDARYQPDVIRLNQIQLDSEKLAFSASGEYLMSQTSSLSLNWLLENFTDGNLFESLELVSVAGNGSLEIDFDASQRRTFVAIADLAGEINTFPLSGAGEISLLDNNIEKIEVDIAAGGNSLALNGLITPAMDLQWRLQAPALNRILSSLQGQANGEGRLTGATESPRINGSFNGTGILYNDENVRLQLDQVQAQARYDGSDNRVELDFVNLVWGSGDESITFSGGDLILSGSLPVHQVSIQTSSSLGDVQLAAAGGYQEKSWNGVFSAVEIQSDYGNWELTQPLSISASAEQASLSEHCWSMTSFRTCGFANWTADSGAAGEIILDDFPLSYLNSRQLIEESGMNDILEVLNTRPTGLEDLLGEYAIALPENSFIDGRVDVESSFSGLGAGWADTRLNFILSPRDLLLGVVLQSNEAPSSPELRIESYGLDEVQLDLRRESAQWALTTGFQIFVPETGGLDFQGAFNGRATLDDNESLNGTFELGFNNIAWLEALVPNLLNPRGELQANGEVAGNLTRPLLVFDASLGGASFELPEFGLLLNNVELSLHSEQDNKITIEGQANSGAGQVSFNSQITTPFMDSRTLDLEVMGSDFQVINLPGTQATVNPDLVFKYDNKILDVNGSLFMPLLDLDVSNNMTLIGNGSVDVSRDVVVVNLPPELEDSVNTSSSSLMELVPVTANVMLGLGDQVRFRGFGLDLKLNGELMLEQSIDRPLLAYGELGIPEGSYGLYGQRLTIDDGKLLFLGNPRNPAVDIRAVRQTPNAMVGLQMNGTIRNLQAQLFSVPGMPESEILSLLVTGRSFQNTGNQEGVNMLNAIALLSLEKGQGLTNNVRKGLGLDMVDISTTDDYRDSALGLGKYLRPNLFMRYDIGLFDRENTLTLQYILTQRMKLEVETGVSQSVDLTYTVEK